MKWEPPVEQKAQETADVTIDEIISRAQFDEKTTNGLVLLDFTATWCGPCKMQLPILQSVTRKTEDVLIYKVDVDKNSGIAKTFNVQGIPQLILLKNGDVHKRFDPGVQDEATIFYAIQSAKTE